MEIIKPPAYYGTSLRKRGEIWKSYVHAESSLLLNIVPHTPMFCVCSWNFSLRIVWSWGCAPIEICLPDNI
jgi:hypothetical protein